MKFLDHRGLCYVIICCQGAFFRSFFDIHLVYSIDDSFAAEFRQSIMDPFSSPPPSGSGVGVSNEVMMDQVKHQLAQAYAEEFFGVTFFSPIFRSITFRWLARSNLPTST